MNWKRKTINKKQPQFIVLSHVPISKLWRPTLGKKGVGCGGLRIFLLVVQGWGVAPGWVEVMDVVSIHMGIFVAAVLCA